MAKKSLPPSTFLVPLPAVLVTCSDGKKANVFTISWCGIVCSLPPMIAIAIRDSRYSLSLVQKSGEFVVNVTTGSMVRAVDFCGNYSGQDCDKFKETGLTPLTASKVKAPLIEESPINLECKVKQSIRLGSHILFIAEIVATHVDEEVLDTAGHLNIKKINPLIYGTDARQYWSDLSKFHGFYGFTKPDEEPK